MNRLLRKIGVVYGILILVIANFITTSFVITQLNFNYQLIRGAQERIISLSNATNKLQQYEGNITNELSHEAKVATDVATSNNILLKQTNVVLNVTIANNAAIIKRIADSLRNTNNQTTAQFFEVARTNQALLKHNDELLTKISNEIQHNATMNSTRYSGMNIQNNTR